VKEPAARACTVSAGDRQFGRSVAIGTKGLRPSQLIEAQQASRFEPVHVQVSVTDPYRLVAIPYLESWVSRSDRNLHARSMIVP